MVSIVKPAKEETKAKTTSKSSEVKEPKSNKIAFSVVEDDLSDSEDLGVKRVGEESGDEALLVDTDPEAVEYPEPKKDIIEKPEKIEEPTKSEEIKPLDQIDDLKDPEETNALVNEKEDEVKPSDFGPDSDSTSEITSPLSNSDNNETEIKAKSSGVSEPELVSDPFPLEKKGNWGLKILLFLLIIIFLGLIAFIVHKIKSGQ